MRLRSLAFAVSLLVASPLRAQLPERLTDSEFWSLVNTLSEPGGFFRSDNFVSNETSFQYVIPKLRATSGTGGVYVGVGPEQNFTYIAAMEPRMAFVVDIRRQNMLQHLMYKVLIESSEDRAEFLARLFARRRPAGVDSTTSIAALLARVEEQTPDSLRFRQVLAEIRRRIVNEHRFALGDSDLTSIAYVYTAFAAAGPSITYTFGTPPRRSGRFMPSFAQLMAETDSVGVQWSFLSSERAYRTLRDLHRRNLIVPVVGDFGGPTALRALGDYLRARGAVVSAFYTSNVEQYLFQQDGVWQAFFANVGTMPVNSSSTFIRAVFGNMRMPVYTVSPDSSGATMVFPPPTMRSVTQLTPITQVLQAVKDGKILSYFDLTRGAW
jgi:hypothetical protein